ncbi:MAG: SpoIVB peptidase [Ruminococcaceae bacterium]|nr:SpoIVB peptidase [Oscillospiraceae bacterium]MBQ9912697.1 SpoIVB peptidase [Clostridia bacterium]
MVKSIKAIRTVIMCVTFILLCLLVYGFYAVPDELYCIADKRDSVNEIYTITYGKKISSSGQRNIGQSEKYEAEVSLLNVIPVKSSSVTVKSRDYVEVSGELFGLRLFTEGVMIVGTDEVDTEMGSVSPAKSAGLQKGDVICSVNGIKVTTSQQVSEIFGKAGSSPMTLVYKRGNKYYSISFSLAYSTSEGKYKAGLWIRDSAAGIGTMTFYDVSTGMFASLGHGVCDVDTGEILPLSDGDIVSAYINGCYKGKSGKAGELCGVFNPEVKGILMCNCETGVYGKAKEINAEMLMPVATKSEVKTGKAQIISTVDKDGPEYYDIEITKVTEASSQNKNMVIKITDSKLIEKTGGIVQGMSGSPIIQDNMLVGAVTHVFVSDPTQGYAIFAETMLEKARSISQQESLSAAS